MTGHTHPRGSRHDTHPDAQHEIGDNGEHNLGATAQDAAGRGPVFLYLLSATIFAHLATTTPHPFVVS